MVRKSVLVYDLLRSEKQNGGYSTNEIFKRVSEIHNITPGKGLKKQIDVALRRGIDFGILVKKNNRYLYDSNDPSHLTDPLVEKKKKGRKKGKKAKKVKKRKKSSSHSKSQRKKTPPSSRKQFYDPVPRPRVPPLPNWTPKRRNLREEPIPKVIKHSHPSPRLL